MKRAETGRQQQKESQVRLLGQLVHTATKADANIPDTPEPRMVLHLVRRPHASAMAESTRGLDAQQRLHK